MYSWLPRDPAEMTTISVPLHRVQYNETIHGGGWFAFRPKRAHQDDYDLAGDWIGPCGDAVTALMVVQEQNAATVTQMDRWKSEILADMRQRGPA